MSIHQKPSGAHFPRKNDIGCYLSEYFDDFVEKLRENRFHQVNLEISRVVIHQFKRLFELWDNNRMVSQSLDSCLFEDVYSLMANSFEKRPNEVSSISSCTDNYFLECKECGEEITIRNNDCEYSYSCHSQSTDHLEFMENLNPPRQFWETREFDVQMDGMNEPLHLLSISKERAIVYIDCNLCSVHISTVNLTENRDNEKCFKESIQHHLQNANHQINYGLFTVNIPYIEFLNEEGRILRCMLCDEIHNFDTLMDHYKSIDHVVQFKAMEQDTKTSQETKVLPVSNAIQNASNEDYTIKYSDKFFIRIMKNAVRCALCEIKLLSSKVTADHMQETFHKKAKKIFLFNENHVQWMTPVHVRCSLCSSPSGFVTDFVKHCQAKSHRQNARFVPYNGNTVLVDEISLDLSQEVFDCSVCQDKYIGIDGLIWHCQFDHKIDVGDESDDGMCYH